MDIINKYGKYLRFLHFDYFFLYTLISEGMVISNQSCIFKRKLFNKYKIKETHNSFDYDLFLKLKFYNKKFVRVKTNASLGAFRIYKEQKSFFYSDYDNLVRKKIINKYKKKNIIYNKYISKLLRCFIIYRNQGLKFLINYIAQINVYRKI